MRYFAQRNESATSLTLEWPARKICGGRAPIHHLPTPPQSFPAESAVGIDCDWSTDHFHEREIRVGVGVKSALAKRNPGLEREGLGMLALAFPKAEGAFHTPGVNASLVDFEAIAENAIQMEVLGHQLGEVERR